MITYPNLKSKTLKFFFASFAVKKTHPLAPSLSKRGGIESILYNIYIRCAVEILDDFIPICRQDRDIDIGMRLGVVAREKIGYK